MKLIDNFNLIEKKWITSNFFISKKFIKCFVRHNKSVRHLFFKKENDLIYAQLFHVKLEKSSNYLKNKFIAKTLLNLFKIKTLYLTNSFFTNASSFEISSKINLNKFLIKLNSQIDYFLLVIPDFLFEKFDFKKNNGFTKVEIEEEMLIKDVNNWTNLKDYKSSLKTKYRKKIINIESQSSDILIQELNDQDNGKYNKQIQKLFDQVLEGSKFSGPKFNTNTLIELQKKKLCSLYLYHFKDNLIGFTSEIYYENKLYSYFVGFDKVINKKYSIYGRMLLETIKNGIKKKCDEIVLGRTANEYKSNFGAIPKKSFIYIRTRKKHTNFLMSYIFKKLKKSYWNQRRPFK